MNSTYNDVNLIKKQLVINIEIIEILNVTMCIDLLFENV